MWSFLILAALTYVLKNILDEYTEIVLIVLIELQKLEWKEGNNFKHKKSKVT